MVKIDPEDWDSAEAGAMDWTLLVLATVIAGMETTNLLRW